MVWLIIIVCVVFVFVSQPVDRMIKKNVKSKWRATALQLFTYWIIFMALYGIAALLGFKIWE